MSNTQYAFIKKEAVPDRNKLQQSIEDLGFDLKLDPEFKPFDDEGFSPCVLNGEGDIGFEIYYAPSVDVVANDSDLKAIAGDNDVCISMCWSSSMKDLASVMIVSSALAKDYAAVISYEGEEPECLERLLTATGDIIKEAEVETLKAVQEQEALNEAKKAGKPEDVVGISLHEISGCVVTGMGVGGMLVMAFSNGSRLSSKAFMCVSQEDGKIDVSNYSRLRAKQISMMEAWGDDLTQEQQEQWDALESGLDKAGEKDERQEQRFSAEVASWPEDLHVEKIEWPQVDKVKLTFRELDNVSLEMYALDSQLLAISFETKHLQFRITNQACELLE